MNTLHALVWIAVAMVALAALEAALPLRALRASRRAHLGPNLALTAITFAANALLNLALVAALAWAQSARLGAIPALALPAPWSAALAVIGFDLAWYATHVSMHHSATLWRFHRVHHSDPAVDVTTAIRQHPGETLIRYAYYTAFGLALGAAPAAFAIYRVWSAMHGLFEHANLRLPLALDSALSWVVASPNMHKVHHSRAPQWTNSNYGNILALFDRAFGTFTPARRGVEIDYGLDGFDDPALQTTAGLLALPFRNPLAGREEPKADPAMPAVDQLNRSSSSSRVIADAAAPPSAASASARLRA
jgi:sterol desaturase/sphingolipid hydroxylase (fatty acid hydroxylase superfamily)